MSEPTKHEPIDPVLARNIALKELKDEGYAITGNGHGIWLEKPNELDPRETRVFFPDWAEELMWQSRRDGANEVRSELRALLKKQ